jgi:hypothetical protein
MKRINKHIWFGLVAVSLLVCGFESLAQTSRFDAANSEGVIASRTSNRILLSVAPDVAGPITIPRIAASIHSIEWQGRVKEVGLSLKPEQDQWMIHWKNRPEGLATLAISFDGFPFLPHEAKPIKASGDGSFHLPAHFAITHGENIRYEPQPHKNTVGFWTGKNDSAHWTIQLDKPGRFNVAVLQGCGKGQGGSQAIAKFISPVKDITPQLEFDVVETGHWQNFQWVQLGEIELRHAGEVEVVVMPKQIKKAALMDIRAIHLIRLPDQKK